MKEKIDDTVNLCFRTRKEDIFYVSIIFEGYEGIAITQTVNKDIAIIRLMISPDFVSEAEEIIESLRGEGIELERVSCDEGALGKSD